MKSVLKWVLPFFWLSACLKDSFAAEALFSSIQDNNLGRLTFAIAEDVDWQDRRDAQGQTPLYAAALRGKPELVQKLLDLEFPINEKNDRRQKSQKSASFLDSHDQTALFAAVSSGNPKIMQIFFEHPQTSFEVTDGANRSIIDWAEIKWLSGSGARPAMKNKSSSPSKTLTDLVHAAIKEPELREKINPLLQFFGSYPQIASAIRNHADQEEIEDYLSHMSDIFYDRRLPRKRTMLKVVEILRDKVSTKHMLKILNEYYNLRTQKPKKTLAHPPLSARTTIKTQTKSMAASMAYSIFEIDRHFFAAIPAKKFCRQKLQKKQSKKINELISYRENLCSFVSYSVLMENDSEGRKKMYIFWDKVMRRLESQGDIFGAFVVHSGLTHGSVSRLFDEPPAKALPIFETKQRYKNLREHLKVKFGGQGYIPSLHILDYTLENLSAISVTNEEDGKTVVIESTLDSYAELKRELDGTAEAFKKPAINASTSLVQMIRKLPTIDEDQLYLISDGIRKNEANICPAKETTMVNQWDFELLWKWILKQNFFYAVDEEGRENAIREFRAFLLLDEGVFDGPTLLANYERWEGRFERTNRKSQKRNLSATDALADFALNLALENAFLKDQLIQKKLLPKEAPSPSDKMAILNDILERIKGSGLRPRTSSLISDHRGKGRSLIYPNSTCSPICAQSKDLNRKVSQRIMPKTKK